MAVADQESRSTYKNMLRGSAWSVATRWGARGIGLVNVVVLARLLTPEDFGLVAIGSLTIGFLRGLTELGVQQLLIRDRNTTRHDSDTAWTVKILQGAFVGVTLFLIAPFAADYFHEPRAVSVIRVFAIGAVLDGMTNIGLVLARKELDFARDFRFQTYARVLRFLVTLTLALVLRSYWALVLGRVLSSVLSVPLSFLMHPYRPRLSFARMRHYLGFSAVMVPLKIGRYLNGKLDVLVVGGMGVATQLGAYNVASDLSAMLTREILTPLGRGLMPNYAKLNHDPARLASAFAYVLGAAATFVLPFGFGLSVTADKVVPVVLGDKWLAAAPLVEFLALYSTVAAISHLMSSQILIASGHERRTAMLSWVRLAFLAPAVVVASRVGGVEAVAMATVVAALAALPVVVVTLTRSIELGVNQVVTALWRPCVAAVVMAMLVRWVGGTLDGATLPTLIAEVVLGAVAYTAVLLSMWILSGRPRGLESVAVDFIVARLSRRQA